MLSAERLHRVACVLGALGLLTTLAAAVTAGVVQARSADDGTGAGVDRSAYDGWTRVSAPGDASYRVPGADDWETHPAGYEVTYEDRAGSVVARGRAPSFYYGNRCSQAGERWAAGWVLVDTRRATGTPDVVAAATARRWATAYGAGPDHTPSPLTEPVTERLAGGSVRATVRIDLRGLTGACLPPRAEVAARSLAGGPTLVAARYLDVPGGIGDEEFARMLASFTR